MSDESVLSRPNVNVEECMSRSWSSRLAMCVSVTIQTRLLKLIRSPFSLHRSEKSDAAVHRPVGVVDFVAVAWDDHGETSLGLELYRVNRKFLVRGHASHASAATLDALEGDEAECRLDGDDLIRCGKLLAAVHMETVDHVLIAVDKQHLVDVLFGHAADHIAVAEVRTVGATDPLSDAEKEGSCDVSVGG